MMVKCKLYTTTERLAEKHGGFRFLCFVVGTLGMVEMTHKFNYSLHLTFGFQTHMSNCLPDVSS